ncbi:HAD-IIIC family phosphatase [Rouxiella badensis]|uniref:HAD-IIIC family phosphatase n=1 Tax=Rouxiella badensis TaxID=1646377 RepID=UPI001D1524DF|nr:HAD-IIIC family phosphatase [Rouxiella badensis]MCC3735240.1 HAD-IIIC family phosphatase [Rouxiella badensis]MCC3760537.1 HAD-IIIC family phosphatase [Rouxiella badensis]
MMTQTPLSAITALRKAGFPTDALPSLQRHLGAISSADDRLHAGVNLRTLAAEAYREQGGSTFRLAVVSNFSYQTIADTLRSRLLARGMLPEFYLSDYNQYHYELLNADSSLYRSSPELTLCLLDGHSVLDELGPNWHPEDIEQGLRNKLHQLTQFAEQYHQQASGLLVFNTLPLSGKTLQQCLDYRGRARISRWWAQFNADLLALAETYRHVFVIDTQSLLSADFPLRDDRLGFYARTLMSNELLDALAGEVAAMVFASRGMAKKCLVLDLDNTLWGGILGDDGIEGIQLSNSATGEAFVSFQQVIKRLSAQGVLLAISSKNERQNVINLLQQREDMVLKIDDFSAIVANWQPKSDALQTISELLNIGSDSLVFVDDSAFEREEVRNQHPQISVVDPGSDPAEYAAALVKGNHFCQLELNPEDYQRSKLYQTEAKRKSLRNASTSLEAFLAELQLKLRLFTPQGQELARVAQLSLRTNQFNMTTRRMSESEVQAYLAQPQHGIIALQSSDRFGEYGVIGCLFYHREHNSLWIDNFLLSCRVFSRQLETAALNHFLSWAQRQGCEEIRARYLPTQKNQQVADFYTRHGFTLSEGNAQFSEYCHALEAPAVVPNHIELIASYQETPL